MRLLEAATYKLQEFAPDQVPEYAILSHTWGDDEVLFDDLQPRTISLQRLRKAYKRKASWKKIEYTCRQALKANLKWVWVDTVCIDKSSSAELSEAINSMYVWYQRSSNCYVYLSDVNSKADFEYARYWSRGWTLQELLAPSKISFYTSKWSLIGTRRDLKDEIAKITGINVFVVGGSTSITTICVAQRMSWAARRQTTRPEDIAYCLMGIFNVNMPTLYGEGEKAFERLQEEILKTSEDQSLFAWTAEDAAPSTPHGLFAKHPRYFQNSVKMTTFRDWTNIASHSISSLGVTISLPIRLLPSGLYEAVLNCRWSESISERVALLLRHIQGAQNQFQRVRVAEALSVGSQDGHEMTRVCIRPDPRLPGRHDIVRPTLCSLQIRNSANIGFEIQQQYTVQSYIHRNVANGNKVSLRRFPEGHHFNDRFVIPGQHGQLSVAICIQQKPKGKLLLLLMGSGAGSFYPAISVLEDADSYVVEINRMMAEREEREVVNWDHDGGDSLFASLCELYRPLAVPRPFERHALKDGLASVSVSRLGIWNATFTFESRLQVEFSSSKQGFLELAIDAEGPSSARSSVIQIHKTW